MTEPMLVIQIVYPNFTISLPYQGYLGTPTPPLRKHGPILCRASIGGTCTLVQNGHKVIYNSAEIWHNSEVKAFPGAPADVGAPTRLGTSCTRTERRLEAGGENQGESGGLAALLHTFLNSFLGLINLID